MWLLTCDGDLYGGKRVWLRPGTTHLLGRTTGRSENGERIQYIDHKSVSRKHLTVEVQPVKAGDSSRVYVRSEISVKDGSKIGTTLNGEKFSQQTKTLDGKEYTIKLGNYEHLFHLYWHPVALSFTALSKKAKGDPLAAQRQKFDQTDIKLITEYITNETTHAIAKKRNTPAALQALLEGRWMVTDGFVDALAAVVRERDSNGLHLLEADFEANWPKEDQYLVPAGGEPQPRPNEYLKPDKNRAEVFQNFVFVFLSQGQYDILLPVITGGGGKALLWEVHINETRVEDVVGYVKQVAGHKGSGQFGLSQQTGKGSVVVVRLNERDHDWREFVRSIDLALGQRSVEQNEFLDAILTVDASGLRKELEEAPESADPKGDAQLPSSCPESQVRQQEQPAVTVSDSPTPARERAPPSAQPAAREQQQEEPQEQSSTAPRRRNRRIITQSRFKGFDDFDPSQFSKPASQSPEPSFGDPEASQAASVQSMDVDQRSQVARTQQSSRKRRAPAQEQVDEEDMYASILTGHAAMKRRKTEAAKMGEKDSFARSVDAVQRDTDRVAKAKRKAKEMDVMAEIQARRKQEEEQRQKDEEHLRQTLDGIDINALKNLAKVEEMEIPVRECPGRGADEKGRSDRWDPAWNGRKNFKKFRPQGARNDAPRLNRVIVTLEEVPRKGHGIGDEYWLNPSTSTNRSKSKSQSQSQSVSQSVARSQRYEDEDEDSARFRRRLQASREEDQENAGAEDVLPEEIAGRARDEALEAAAHSTPSQTLRTESQSKAAGKRPATQQVGGPPAKKARQSRLAAPSRETISLDDDDEDELKFRRRRR